LIGTNRDVHQIQQKAQTGSIASFQIPIMQMLQGNKFDNNCTGITL